MQQAESVTKVAMTVGRGRLLRSGCEAMRRMIMVDRDGVAGGIVPRCVSPVRRTAADQDNQHCRNSANAGTLTKWGKMHGVSRL
jgi:hypothetical protein